MYETHLLETMHGKIRFNDGKRARMHLMFHPGYRQTATLVLCRVLSLFASLCSRRVVWTVSWKSIDCERGSFYSLQAHGPSCVIAHQLNSRQLSCVYLEFCILFLSTSMIPFHSYFTSAAVSKLSKLWKYLKVLRNESVMWMMTGLIVIISCYYKTCVVSVMYTCRVCVSFLLNCENFKILIL